MTKNAVTLLLIATAGALPGIVGYRYGFQHGADLTLRAITQQRSSEPGSPDRPSGAKGQNFGSREEAPAHPTEPTWTPQHQNPNRDSLGQSLIQAHENLATMNAAQILEALKTLKSGAPSPESDLIQQLMTAHLAQRDPELALGFAATLTGDQQRGAVRTALGVWTQTDPVRASEYFRENLNDFGVLDAGQRDAAKAIASQWGKSNPEAALQWAQALPEEVRLDALLPVMSELARSQPDRVVEAINDAEPGYERNQLIEKLVAERSATAPQETAEWIRGITDPNEQSQAASHVVQGWAKTDPASATKWVSSLAGGITRDSAIGTLVDSPAFRENPQTAIQWASSIQDEGTRANASLRITSRWEILDPAAAQAWQAR